MTCIPLPIDAVLPELVAALNRQSGVVLRAPTGAGKTTRVPPALLDSGLAGTQRIVMLEPRRLAARAAARRMTAERGGRLGEDIGYHVRFDRQFGPRTRILVVTEGLLVRMLHDDPFLESVHTVIFDEFHERSLDTDLALGMVRLVQQTVRPDLRIVVMSATLAVEAVARYLGDCPIIASEGYLHPVQILYEPRRMSQPWAEAIAQAVEWLLDRTAGDLLVFLPGLQEIRQTARHLEPLAQAHNLAVLPLHGDLPAEQQDAALLKHERRKVVLATNVAETSVTVEGITGVIDTGLARMLKFDEGVGLDRLQLTPIAKASAEQRCGRAGRTAPGVCVRLWSEAGHRQRPEQSDPEVRRVDLAGAVLQLLRLGESNLGQFPWFEPPPQGAVTRAFALLQRLGAVQDQGITELGRTLARLPVHPRLGRLLVEGCGHVERAALTAALLSERSPFTRSLEAAPAEPQPTSSDVLDQIEALEEYERSGQLQSRFGTLHKGASRFILRARDQLLRAVRKEVRGRKTILAPDEAVLRSLLAAYPDRLARRRAPGSRRGVMVGGRGVRLGPGSGVLAPELFLCIDVDAGQTETLVRLASAVQRDWLPADLCHDSIEVEFDPESERVIARRRLRFLDLLIEETPAALPDADAVSRVLAAAAADHLDRVLPPPDSPAGQYLTRLRCLRDWMPELQLPAFDDGELHELLPWVCQGCRSFADVQKTTWIPAFQSKLSHTQRQALEREAPERLEVPSGSRVALRYEVGRPPILAVRIQELYGLAQTPRIAAGRIRVLLHLLGPNFRPQQVTDDLASFWTNTYPHVRKELRARYPKHAWPEDPWTAPPQRQPGRKP